MYRIQILSKSNTPITSLPEFSAQLRSYSKVINKAGKCSFSIDKSSPFAIKSNFSLFNRVIIKRFNGSQFVTVWIGYLESVIESEGRVNMGCVELINLFDKRVTGNLTLTGNAGTAISDMLTTTNADDDTFINMGNNNYTTALDQKLDKKTLLDAWEDIAKTEESEFAIDNSFNLNLGLLGADKSATVTLSFNRDTPEHNTIENVRINETGSKVINRVRAIGKNKAGSILTAVVENAGSISSNGLLEKVISFNDAESVGALTELAQGELDKLKDVISNPEIKPLQLRTVTNLAGVPKTIGLDVSDMELGDIVKLWYNTQWISINENRRIVAFTVSLDDTGAESINLKLNKVDQNIELLASDEDSERDKEKNQRQLQNRVFNI
jgi:hypothetical protein